MNTCTAGIPLIVAAALTLAAASAAPAEPLALGQTAPATDVAMRNVDGRDLTITAARGPKGTLVLFTCNHCPWVKFWDRRIAEIGNGAVKRGLGVIAINANDPAAYPDDSFAQMQKRARSLRLKYPYVVDATSDVARAFGATRTPEAFLFDAEGRLVYHGTVDDNAKEPKQVKSTYLKDAVEALLAGRPAPLAETKALGCTIKFRKSD